MTRYCLTGLMFLFVQCLFGQKYLTSSTIVPERDMYYIENWHLQGEIKSIHIQTHQSRNTSMRFARFESCREQAKPGSDFVLRQDRYDFNRQGKLIKLTQVQGGVKSITLFSYNFFGKIAKAESGEKLMVFHYDGDGRLVKTESKKGARTDMFWEVIYRGDSIVTVTHDLLSQTNDTLVERTDSLGRIIYSSTQTTYHDKKETFSEYDQFGRIVRQNNNLGQVFEYVYDNEGRLLQSFVGTNKEFMAFYEYDQTTGIVKTTRMEMINGQYVARNYECKCTAIDGKNNPIKSEFIDCDNSLGEAPFCLNQFYEVEYHYFNP
jgi:YD repeat-containing protein